MPDDDHEQLAKDLSDESDRLAQASERLGEKIEHVRSDWQRKQEDPAVPGATKSDSGEGDDGSEGSAESTGSGSGESDRSEGEGGDASEGESGS